MELWRGWRVGNLHPTFELVLWFTKPYRIGATIADNVLNHGVGGYNEEAFLRYFDRRDNKQNKGFATRESGLHPTQKPVKLMQALVETANLPRQVVFDPFCGSGSSLAAARNLDRRYIGCDIDPT